MKVWNIKQFANETGIPVDTLRYYEKEGLLSPKRQDNGYRCYDENALALVKNIAVMKYPGVVAVPLLMTRVCYVTTIEPIGKITKVIT